MTGALAGVSQPLIRWNYIGDHLGLIWSAIVQHLELTFIAVSIGFVIASVLASIAIRLRLTYQPLNLAMGVAYAVPSIALFILLAPVTGLSTLTAEIALVSYTLQILFRSIVAGIDGVPASVRESAAAMGYTRRQQRWRVEIPLGLPVIMSGLRIATVTTVGLVPIAGILGADQGGLGRLIFDGLDRGFNTPLFVGALLTVVLAVGLDVLIVQLERLLTPWTRQVRAS